MRISTHTLRATSLPVVIAIGTLLCYPISDFDEWSGHSLTPIFIFLMLFVTFCSVDIRKMRPNKMFIWLLLAQIIGCIAVYFALAPFNTTLAEGAMICVLAPIAMAAVVIGGILGANVETMTSYTLICNLATALLTPAIISITGSGNCSFEIILAKVAPLLIAPFVVGQLCRYTTPRISKWVAKHSIISFYLWLCSLTVLIGRTSVFIINYGTNESILEIGLASIAFVICIAQFTFGRYIGNLYGDKIAGGQSLGQKNTVLAIWLAQSFLHPLACVAPAAYIVWQNIVNSFQIYNKEKRSTAENRRH